MNLRPLLAVPLYCVLLSVTARAWAYSCAGAHCDTGKLFCQVDCTKYVETPVINGVTPVSVPEQTTLYKEYSGQNCANAQPLVIEPTLTVSDTQSGSITISGSGTGSESSQIKAGLEGAITAEVGTTASWTVGASGTYTLSSQTTDTCTTKLTVPACQDGYLKLFTGYKNGSSFSQKGDISWSVGYYNICLVSPETTLTGTCDTVNGSGSGSYKYNIETWVPNTFACSASLVEPPCGGG